MSFEQIYETLIKIYAEQENVKVDIRIERRENE
nr:MAG TPA: hypothetical protein [Caudoviricetes sp.]